MSGSRTRKTAPGNMVAALFLCLAATGHATPDFRTIAFHAVPLTGNSVNGSTEPTGHVPADTELLKATAEQYRISIGDLEVSGGPFNILVAEQAEALGDLLQNASDHEGAIAAYDKSLHILRVNEGLYSPGQEPLLRKAINSQLAMNNIDRADELHGALLYLQKKLHEKGDAGYIAAILEWADWNVDQLLARYDAVMPGSPGQNLISAQENYIEAIELIRASGDTSPAQQHRLVHAEKKLAAINYIANRAAAMQVASGSATSMFAGPAPFTAEQRQAENAGLAFFFNGSNALKRAIAYSLESPQPDYLSIAEQMMALGDWHLLFDRRAAALAIYEDAFDLLDAVQASDDDIQRIMTPGMPVSIPASSSSAPAASDIAGYIDVEFQVSKYGIASHPEIIATSEQYDSPVTSALIRKIRQEKFRPAFIDGSATGSENVKLRYYYSYN